jgi:hypothetical protein
VGDTNAADGAARAGDAGGGEHGLMCADAFQHGVHAKATGELAHALDRFVAALTDDVSCAERFRKRDPLTMATEDNDLLGAKAFRSDDAAQAHRAVADDRHSVASASLCGDDRMMAGSHYVRER